MAGLTRLYRDAQAAPCPRLESCAMMKEVTPAASAQGAVFRFPRPNSSQGDSSAITAAGTGATAAQRTPTASQARVLPQLQRVGEEFSPTRLPHTLRSAPRRAAYSINRFTNSGGSRTRRSIAHPDSYERSHIAEVHEVLTPGSRSSTPTCA